LVDYLPVRPAVHFLGPATFELTRALSERTANCSSSTAAWRSPAAPASLIGGGSLSHEAIARRFDEGLKQHARRGDAIGGGAAHRKRGRVAGGLLRLVDLMPREDLAAALEIATPYFLPDRDAPPRPAAPGETRRPDHRHRAGCSHRSEMGASRQPAAVRIAAPRGVRIFDYDPGMTHVKALIVDVLWSVIGTTNFDNRSFEHNDEVNVVVRDANVASRLMVDLAADMARSREIVADGWKARPLWEKLVGTVAWILERQQ
jgi:PLD-like domain